MNLMKAPIIYLFSPTFYYYYFLIMIDLFLSFQVNGNMTVDAIDFYIADTFGEGLYNSCKDVKFGTMNTRAIEFIGAGAKNFEGDLL